MCLNVRRLERSKKINVISLTDGQSKETPKNYKTYTHKTPLMVYKIGYRKLSILRDERSQIDLLDTMNSS